MKREMKMIKRTLIAIAVVALLATSTQALGPDPHTGTFDKQSSIKVNIMEMDIGWPFEYKALDLCAIPVYMHVGYFVQVFECHKRKIKLQQVDCGDIGQGSGDWPCYLDCEDVKIRANFEVKLGLKKEKNAAGDDIIDKWDTYFDGGDVVAGDGDWHTVTVCVKAWKARLQKHSPGQEVQVGTLYVTVKPNV
ncbi:MAG: hypothetical protein CEE38_18515 [Planctomycetes bacterium B3_Pla]|nr:MAG: hypothetical protein CEE38_18515 [Planctomycetes bacterium B3_Pla]